MTDVGVSYFIEAAKHSKSLWLHEIILDGATPPPFAAARPRPTVRSSRALASTLCVRSCIQGVQAQWPHINIPPAR